MNSYISRHSPSLALIFLSLAASAVMLNWSFDHLPEAKDLLNRCGFYAVLVMTIVWYVTLFPFFRKALKGNLLPVLGCLAATTLVFVSSPPQYRVLSDETNLLSVSQSMAYRQEILNVTEGKFYFGNFNPVAGDLPTRPLLFPFLTSLVHVMSGYRYQNVFALNFLLLWAFLCMIYLSVRERAGTRPAVATCLLLLSIPTLTLSATSGGFDLCSLFFFGLSFILLRQFLAQPSSRTFAMLSIQLILLSQIRYESIAYVTLILAAILLFRRFRLRLITLRPLLYAATPWLLLPMLLQRKLTPNTFENPPGVPPFSAGHFLKHLRDLVQGMIHFQPDFPYPSLLNLLAFAMIVAILLRAFMRLRLFHSRVSREWTLILTGTVTLGLAIVLSHHFGYFPHPTQARLFLVFLSALALIPLAFHLHFPALLNQRRLLGIAAGSFLLYHPVAIQARFPNALTIVRETEEVYRFLKTESASILLVIERPGQFTVANRGAVGFDYATRNEAALLADLQRGVFSDIVVVQKIRYADGRPAPGHGLPAGFQLNPVKELMITGEELLRISRVSHGFYPERAPEAPLAKVEPGLNREIQNILKIAGFKH